MTSDQRRSKHLTVHEKYGVAVAGVVAGVVCGLADTAMTGNRWIDLVYRIALGVGMAVAGCRARRTPLVVSSAVAATATVGPAQFLAVGACVLGAVLAVRDVRSRYGGAIVGGCVAIAALHLSVPGPDLATVAVAVGVCCMVMVSGYRNARRSHRRTIRRIALSLAVCAVVCVGLAGAFALSVKSDVTNGVRLASEGVDSTKSGERAAAQDAFVGASASFSSGVDTATAWWWAPLSLVPGIAQNVNAVQQMASAGEQLATAAYVNSSDVDFEKLKGERGSINLAQLRELIAPVQRVEDALGDGAKRSANAHSRWLVSPLASRVDEFDQRLSRFRREIEVAKSALEVAPAMLGESGQRRYLVLLSDPAELRDLGGHIGNWASLTTNNGKLVLEHVGLPGELSDPSGDTALESRDDLPRSLIEMRPAKFPQNWGSHSDFASVSKLSSELYERATGQRVDGVMYADPQVFATMMQLTGAVRIPKLDRVLEPSQAVKFLTSDQFDVYSDDPTANASVSELVQVVFERFTAMPLPSPKRFGDLFSGLRDGGDLRLSARDPHEQEFLETIGLSDTMPTDEDFLFVANRNANPSKIDAYLHRTTTYDVRFDQDTGVVDATATVELRNDAPTWGRSNLVLGGNENLPLGTNLTDVVILTPWPVESATVNGTEVALSSLREMGWWRHTVRVSLGSQSSSTVQFHLGGVASFSAYRLQTDQQPLLTGSELKIKTAIAVGDGSALSTPGKILRDERSTSAHRMVVEP